MKNPNVSIVMPFYNRKNELAEMVKSIQSNTYDDWELLLVDDGSDEAIKKEVRDLIFKEERIRFIERDREPKGANTCRNIGLEKAVGKYILFFDSDDVISSSCLATRVEAIEANQEYDFLLFTSFVYKEGKVIQDVRNQYGVPIYHNDLKAFLHRTLPFIVCNGIYKRQSLVKHQIQWNERLRALQDADFNVSCLVAGLKYCYIHSTPDYGYRIDTQDSVSKQIFKSHHNDSLLHAVEHYYQLVQNIYSHRYDKDLFFGAEEVLIRVIGLTYNKAFAHAMTEVLKPYSPRYSKRLQRKIQYIEWLSRFMPYRRARQLGFGLFLMLRYSRFGYAYFMRWIKLQ